MSGITWLSLGTTPVVASVVTSRGGFCAVTMDLGPLEQIMIDRAMLDNAGAGFVVTTSLSDDDSFRASIEMLKKCGAVVVLFSVPVLLRGVRMKSDPLIVDNHEIDICVVSFSQIADLSSLGEIEYVGE